VGQQGIPPPSAGWTKRHMSTLKNGATAPCRAQHKQNWESELRKSFEMWNELKNNGGTDPSWSDGVNMNLIRNHILYYKDQLLRNQPENLPAIYFTKTPPEVDSNYMANKEKICADTMELLRIISGNSDF
jgi:squalene cyclase